jgi:hypothetical protein
MRTWLQLFEERKIIERDLLDIERDLATMVLEEELLEIEHLQNPHGKRFLFDDPCKVAEYTATVNQTPSASSMTPLIANLPDVGWARECVFVPVCERACRTCVRICASLGAPTAAGADT